MPLFTSAHRLSSVLACSALTLAVLSDHAIAKDLNWQAEPSYEAVSLHSGFSPNPYSVTLKVGGLISATNSAADFCAGNVANAEPDVTLDFTAGDKPLFISSLSARDTTLVIHAPDGSWHCGDDYAGRDPAVVFIEPQSGDYAIWVGSYDEDDSPNTALLRITEREPVSTINTTSADSIYWGDDSRPYSNNGECDDPRFLGDSVAPNNVIEDRYRDASDCRALYEAGKIHIF